MTNAARGSMDGKTVSPKDSIGYDPIPTYNTGTPATQTGIVPSLVSETEGSQTTKISEAPILLEPYADMPADGPWNSEPRDDMSTATTNVGAGSLGSDIDGWHPAKAGG